MSTCRFTPIAVAKRPMEGGDNSEGSDKVPTERLDCVLSSALPPRCAASNLEPTYEGLRARETCEKECIAPYLTSKKGKEERTCSGKIYDGLAFDDDDKDENGNYTRRLSLSTPNGKEICTTVDSFLGWIRSQTKFVIWTKNMQTYNRNTEDEHDQGYGYAPLRPYIKLRVLSIPEKFYFVLDKTGDAIIRYMRRNKENSTIYLFMVRTRLPNVEDEDGRVGVYRYGNQKGHYTISGSHGQSPGTAVYLLRSTVPDHSTLTHEMAFSTSTLAYEPLGETAYDEGWIGCNRKFFLAVYNGDVEEVQRILRDYDGDYDFGDVEVLREEVQRILPDYDGDYDNADLLIFNLVREYDLKSNPTALHLAASQGHVEVVKELCIFFDDQSKLELVMNYETSDSYTPLLIAAENGHAEMVKVLIKYGADVNKEDEDDYSTPLWIAAQDGHAEVVKVLIKAEADVNKTGQGDITPLWIAAGNEHVEVVQVLIEAGADVNKAETDGTTPLWIAAQNGHAEVVHALIEARAYVNKAETDGTTPLWIAAKNEHAEVVQALIEAGADVNKAETNGVTPLSIAAEYGHAEVVYALLESDADVDKADWKGATPLWIAAENGHAEVVKLLIMYGADVNKEDKYYYTTLLWIAARKGHVEVVKVLIKAKADVNKTSRGGQTPLWIAAETGHAEVVQALIEAGADVNKAETDGTTPLLIAAQNGHANIVRALIKAGAKANCH